MFEQKNYMFEYRLWTISLHTACKDVLSIVCEEDVCPLFVEKNMLAYCLWRRWWHRQKVFTLVLLFVSPPSPVHMSFCLYVHHNTYSVMLSLLATTDSRVFQKSCFWNLSDERKGKGQSKALVVIQQVLLKMVGAHLPWKVSDCCLWQICCIFHCNRK